ncbi:MAG: cytochrome c [Paracoccaceae bacterium]
MYKLIIKFLCVGLIPLSLPSCTDMVDEDRSMPTRSDGAAFFAQNCTSCHGADARGAGPSARALKDTPTDLTKLSAENGGTFPEARALAYIYGDPVDSHLARVMPQFGDEMALDLVPVEIEGILTPTPRELAGLLFYLESIQQ